MCGSYFFGLVVTMSKEEALDEPSVDTNFIDEAFEFDAPKWCDLSLWANAPENSWEYVTLHSVVAMSLIRVLCQALRVVGLTHHIPRMSHPMVPKPQSLLYYRAHHRVKLMARDQVLSEPNIPRISLRLHYELPELEPTKLLVRRNLRRLWNSTSSSRVRLLPRNLLLRRSEWGRDVYPSCRTTLRPRPHYSPRLTSPRLRSSSQLSNRPSPPILL